MSDASRATTTRSQPRPAWGWSSTRVAHRDQVGRTKEERRRGESRSSMTGIDLLRLKGEWYRARRATRNGSD